MFEEAEHLELSEDALGGDERLEYVGQLLEGDAPAIARVRHSPVDKQHGNKSNYIFYIRQGLCPSVRTLMG